MKLTTSRGVRQGEILSLCGQYWIKNGSFQTLKILSCSRRKVCNMFQSMKTAECGK